MSRNCFFIFGCPRSGTSLLSRILNEHPNLAVPNESHIFAKFHDIAFLFGDLSVESSRASLVDAILGFERIKVDWGDILDRDQVLSKIRHPHFGGIFDAFLTSWAQAQGKKRWGEKTPQHIYWWRPIMKYFPKARIIYIVRDGRDVSLSLLNATFGPVNIYTAGKYWKYYLEIAENLFGRLPDDQAYILRYEDLLTDPQTVLKDVCEFLGEKFVPQMLDFYQKKASANIDTTNFENLQRPVLKNNAQKWKKEMSCRNIRIFESVAKEWLASYGYETVFERPRLSNPEKFYLNFFHTLPTRAIKMAQNYKAQRIQAYMMKVLIRKRLENAVGSFYMPLKP